MASTLILTFSETTDVLLNETIFVRINDGVSVINLQEVFKTQRFRVGQSPIPDPYDPVIAAQNFSFAWRLDYYNTGSNGSLDATSDSNIVTITLNNSDWQIEEPTGTSISNNSITYSINNEAVTVEKSLTIDEYATNPSNKCTKANVTLTAKGGDNSYNIYIDNVLVASDEESPFTLVVDRGRQSSIRVVDMSNTNIGSVVTQSLRRLISNDISASILNTSNGATINVSVTFISSEISSYEYSLDDVTYQDSNTFTGQENGSYTIYVKDGFGCVTERQIIVDGSTAVTETIFDVSEINSLRFSKYDLGKKNQKNTLSNNELRLKNYTYYQQFLENDVITTQFKTNAKYINCFSFNKNTRKTLSKENEILWSGDKENEVWFNKGLDITDNRTVANGDNQHYLSQDILKNQEKTIYTTSFRFKPQEYNVISLLVINTEGSNGDYQTKFDSRDNSFNEDFIFGGMTFIEQGFSIEDDGFIRVFVTLDMGSSTKFQSRFMIADDSYSTSFSGTSVNGIYTSGLLMKDFQVQTGNLGEYVQTGSSKIKTESSFGDLLTTIKKTNNIGLKQKSTSTYFDLGNGRSGIYFGVVDLLDYLTDEFVETVNYGFALPQWASVEGALVTIDGIGQVPIDGISYSETYSSFVLQFNIAYTGSNINNKIISAEYNLQPYEIYEFNVNVTDDFNVVIEAGVSSNDIDFTYISECVKKVEDSEFLFDITYWDEENKGAMNYQTGIRHKLRLNGYQDYIGEQETQGYNGDKEFYVTDNVVYDVQKFTFNRLSSQMASKLRLVVAHSNILINGLFYKLSEAPDVSGDGNFNLKIFSVNLKQSGEQFLTTEQENITNTPEDAELIIALASAKEKGILSWTKNY